jgi:hypothetical protein
MYEPKMSLPLSIKHASELNVGVFLDFTCMNQKCLYHLQKNMPVVLTWVQSKPWTAVQYSEYFILSFYPTWRMNICLHLFFVFCGNSEWPCYRQLPSSNEDYRKSMNKIPKPKKIGDIWPHWYLMSSRKYHLTFVLTAPQDGMCLMKTRTHYF